MHPRSKLLDGIAVQTIIAPLLILGIGLPVTYCVARFTPRAWGSTNLAYYGLLLVVPLLGFCVGYGACARAPRLYPSAKYVWLLPAILAMLFVLFCEAGSVRERVLAFVAPDFLLLLIAWPVSSCCAYSLGAAIAHWSRRGPQASSQSTAARASTGRNLCQ
jgi:hypothetical protein